jgi:hypothetical protein
MYSRGSDTSAAVEVRLESFGVGVVSDWGRVTALVVELMAISSG